jgi:hypothetical protein
MHVVVPAVLVTGGLVVLAQLSPVAAVRPPDGDRDLTGEVVDRMPGTRRQVVQILVMGVRHHQHMTVIPGPPARRDERGGRLRAPHHIALGPMVILATRDQPSEGTHIVSRRMVEHGTPDDPR